MSRRWQLKRVRQQAAEGPAGISEDYAPQAGVGAALVETIAENYTPYIGVTSVLAPPPSHTDKTRRTIALGLLGLVGLLTIAAFGALIIGSWPDFTADQFKELNLFFTPIVALASAAFGFYFGSDPKDKS